MNKFLIISISLFVCGVIAFYSALDCYRTVQVLQETPIPYDTVSNKLVRDAVAGASTRLRIVIIINLILGFGAWILGLVLFVKRNNLSYK